MVASSGFMDASRRHPDAPSTAQHPNFERDDVFGSFTVVERLSDPFGDVNEAEAKFKDFEGSSGGHKTTFSPSVDA